MNAKRILIAEVNWLGDVLFSTPFIRAVRNNFTNAYIACMIVPRVKEVLEGNPYINEIIEYNAGANGRSPLQNLKKYNFDTVFLLHRSFSRALKMFIAGIPNRIGYYTFKRALLLTCKAKPPDASSLHRAEFYLGLARAVGLKTDDKGCDFFVSRQDLEWAGVLTTGYKTIVFNPGGNWMPKRWPAENFISLGKMLLEKFGDSIKIIITGASKDMELTEGIKQALGGGAISVGGKATLKQSAAVFKKADVFVSADSGPLHIAVSAGANVIGIFGPTSIAVTGPYRADKEKTVILRKDVGCNIPCYDEKCSDYRCMAAVTPGEVFEAVKRFLG